MPKSDLNKVAMQSKFVEITFRYGCSPVNLQHSYKKNLFIRTLWRPASEQNMVMI